MNIGFDYKTVMNAKALSSGKKHRWLETPIWIYIT